VRWISGRQQLGHGQGGGGAGAWRHGSTRSGTRRSRPGVPPRRSPRGPWLEKNPAHLRATRVGGGEQPLWDDEPENNDVGARFAAAVEYWRAFRDQARLKKLEKADGLRRGDPRRQVRRRRLGQHQPLRHGHARDGREDARRRCAPRPRSASWPPPTSCARRSRRTTATAAPTRPPSTTGAATPT
jgi:hypothetical protein